MWSLSVPSSLNGWGRYLLTVGVPIMVMFALSTRVFSVADNIYDGSSQ
jgi:hypothetical protein